MRKYVVRESKEPDQEGTHIVVLRSHTQYGFNDQRVFKGTQKECEKYRDKKMEELKNAGSDNKKGINKARI